MEIKGKNLNGCQGTLFHSENHKHMEWCVRQSFQDENIRVITNGFIFGGLKCMQ